MAKPNNAIATVKIPGDTNARPIVPYYIGVSSSNDYVATLPTLTADATLALKDKDNFFSSDQTFNKALIVKRPAGTYGVYMSLENVGTSSSPYLYFTSYTAEAAGTSRWCIWKEGDKLKFNGDRSGSDPYGAFSIVETSASSTSFVYSKYQIKEEGTLLKDKYAPISHATTATTYGLGTSSNYGHVKLVSGDLNGKTETNGLAASQSHTHSQYITVPESKTYTGLYTSGTDHWRNANFYFINIRPNSWQTEWSIQYRLECDLDDGLTPTDYQYMHSTHECFVSGARGIFSAYAMLNNINYTSRRVIGYHAIAETTETGYNNNCGHKIGISLHYNGLAYQSTNASYKRTIKVTIIKTVGCTATFESAPLIAHNSDRSDYTKLNSTYYPYSSTESNTAGYMSVFNAYSNGMQETSDDNSTDLIYYHNHYSNISSFGLPGYTIFGYSPNGDIQAISLYQSGYTSYTTSISTTRVYNTNGFDYSKPLLRWASSDFYAGDTTNVNIHSYKTQVFDFRYTDNCVSTAGTTLSFVRNKEIYLRGTIGSDGLFYLAPIEVTYNGSTYKRAWTQDIPSTEDGYVYWLIGHPYSTDAYQLRLYVENPLYWFKNGEFREYQQPASTTQSGVVTTGTQTFAGDKNFSGQLAVLDEEGISRIDTYALYGIGTGITVRSSDSLYRNFGLYWGDENAFGPSDSPYFSYQHGNSLNDIEFITVPVKSGELVLDSTVSQYQSSSVIVGNATTNINGRVFQNYTANLVTDGGYTYYQILKNGNNPTEEEAKEYMRYMTGSTFLPTYNYDFPKQTIFTFADRSTWKPQYSSNDGLRLYRLTTSLALASDITITSATDDILDATITNKALKYAPYTSKGAGHLYTGTTAPSSTNRLNYDGYFYATKLYSGGNEVKTTDTNYYPTAMSWTNGTTAGPTATITMSGTSNISVGAIPAASATQSGIITTGDQTFAGNKTLTDSLYVGSTTTSNVDLALLTKDTLKIEDATHTTTYQSTAYSETSSSSFKLYSHSVGGITMDPATTVYGINSIAYTPANIISSTYTLSFPSKSGTLATTSDFSVVTTSGSQSVTANGNTLSFGSNAFNSTTIPTTYLKNASVSGNTLTITPNSGSAITFTPTSGGVVITTTTGSEAVGDGTNSLNVMTRDTVQTVSATKTFTAKQTFGNPSNYSPSNVLEVGKTSSYGGGFEFYGGGASSAGYMTGVFNASISSYPDISNIKQIVFHQGNPSTHSAYNYSTTLIGSANSTANRTITLPDKNGTVAMLSDITSTTSINVLDFRS